MERNIRNTRSTPLNIKYSKRTFHTIKILSKATHQVNRFQEYNKTLNSIEEITLITLFNKHCNSVDDSPKPVLTPHKGVTLIHVIDVQKIKTNNDGQPEVHFNIVCTIALESVTFLMVDKHPMAIMALDEKVINLDKFLMCNDFDDWLFIVVRNFAIKFLVCCSSSLI